jgi:hypothetical protein
MHNTKQLKFELTNQEAVDIFNNWGYFCDLLTEVVLSIRNIYILYIHKVGWPAKFRETKFREMFREIFISHFAKFYNDFREILRNFAKQNIWKFREFSRKWSYKTVQKQILSPFHSLILVESEFQLNIS